MTKADIQASVERTNTHLQVAMASVQSAADAINKAKSEQDIIGQQLPSVQDIAVVPPPPPPPPEPTPDNMDFDVFGAAVEVSETEAKVTGPFSIKVKPITAKVVEKVVFKYTGKDGAAKTQEEKTAPYFLFGDTSGIAILDTFNNQTVNVEIFFAGTTATFKRDVLVKVETPPTPPPPQPEVKPWDIFIPAHKNFLKNADFTKATDLAFWNRFTGSMRLENGALRIGDGFAHCGQNYQVISPKGRIRYAAKVKGSRAVPKTGDSGVGIYADMRVISTDATLGVPIAVTANMPASMSDRWAIIECELIVPEYAHPRVDIPKVKWRVYDAETLQEIESGTSGLGANIGRINNKDNGLYDPRPVPFYYAKLGTIAKEGSTTVWVCDAAAAAAGKCNNPLPSQMKIVAGPHNWFQRPETGYMEWMRGSYDPPGTF